MGKKKQNKVILILFLYVSYHNYAMCVISGCVNCFLLFLKDIHSFIAPVDELVNVQKENATDETLSQLSADPLLDILHNVFNVENFRGMQRQVVESIMGNKDILAVIPTGGRKSLCYWVPGIATPGVTVVITPLLALLNVKLGKLRQYGTDVSYIIVVSYIIFVARGKGCCFS